MIERREFLQALAVTGLAGSVASRAARGTPQVNGSTERRYWISVLTRLADPIPPYNSIDCDMLDTAY